MASPKVLEVNAILVESGMADKEAPNRRAGKTGQTASPATRRRERGGIDRTQPRQAVTTDAVNRAMLAGAAGRGRGKGKATILRRPPNADAPHRSSADQRQGTAAAADGQSSPRRQSVAARFEADHVDTAAEVIDAADRRAASRSSKVAMRRQMKAAAQKRQPKRVAAASCTERASTSATAASPQRSAKRTVSPQAKQQILRILLPPGLRRSPPERRRESVEAATAAEPLPAELSRGSIENAPTAVKVAPPPQEAEVESPVVEATDVPCEDGKHVFSGVHVVISTHDIRNVRYRQVILGCWPSRSNCDESSGLRFETLLFADAHADEVRAAVSDLLRLYKYRQSLQEPPRGRDAPIKSALPFLDSQFIHPLRKKSVRFASAVYFCRVCDYHIGSVAHARQHLLHDDHQKTKSNREFVRFLGDVPLPTEAQCNAVGQLVAAEVEARGRPIEHLLACSDVEQLLTAMFKQIDADCFVRLYGSCQTRTALRGSDVNFELVYPAARMNHAAALLGAYELLVRDDSFVDVCKEFDRRWPLVSFFAVSLESLSGGSPRCRLSVNNQQAAAVGRLLNIYFEGYKLAEPLARMFRIWAKVCGVDTFPEGGLPRYALDMMVVHYLQQIGCLPVLKEGRYDSAEESDESFRNYWIKMKEHKVPKDYSLGELWIGLFRFYVFEFDSSNLVVQIRRAEPLTRDEKGWNRKRIAVEDPYLPSKNIAQLTPTMYDYLSSCLLRSFRYFGIPQLRSGPLFQLFGEKLCVSAQPPLTSPAAVSPASPVTNCAQHSSTETTLLFVWSRNTLWMQVAVEEIAEAGGDGASVGGRFAYSRERLMELQTEIQKRCVAESLRTRRRRSSACPMAALLTAACNCKALARELTRDLTRELKKKRETVGSRLAAASLPLDSCRCPSTADSESLSSVPSLRNDFAALAVDVDAPSDSADSQSPVEHVCVSPKAQVVKEAVDDASHVAADTSSVLRRAAERVTREELHYRFDASVVSGGQIPQSICAYCHGAGHSESRCEEKVFPVLPLVQPFRDYTLFALLQQSLLYVDAEFRMSVERQRQLRWTCNELERQLNASGLFSKECGECTLTLFGSAVNGFGFKHSDLDLCLRFNEESLRPDIDATRVIKQLSRFLAKQPNFCQVLPVVGAKVPIVRFRHVPTDCPGDISLYNVLALRNSRLLRAYCDVDRRVSQLGIIVKVWAKQCDIGDASKGSLSSYAYVIMMLHYLQRSNFVDPCQPPVIPCLQQSAQRRPVLVDGWDTFFREPERRPKSGNSRDLASLWQGFLRFYTEFFDYKTDVIQIRRMQPLSKFEKLWTDRPMAIEDPFDLNHNLTAGLSKKMFRHIRLSLIRARELFCLETTLAHAWRRLLTSRNPSAFDRASALFNWCPLGVAPPRDRQCRVCGHVGHFAEQCPTRRGNRQRADSTDDGDGGDEQPSADAADASDGAAESAA